MLTLDCKTDPISQSGKFKLIAFWTMPFLTMPAMPITIALKSVLFKFNSLILFLISASSISVMWFFGVGSVHSVMISSEVKTEKFVDVPPKSTEKA